MNPLNEIDSHFVKCIGYLHASSKLAKGDPVPLQYVLEEAIKNKYGIVKDYTELVQSCLTVREDNLTPINNPGFEESKASDSDNELELDLLKEDLMCVICNGMDVGARNRLVECSDCHSLYHQECHQPGITEDSFENWVCFNCKEANKKLKQSIGGSSSNQATSSKSIKSSSHRQTGISSYKNSNYSR
ncbi:integrator complex subunit 12 [Diorhabda carinulata]|uniref:integrator complex subunit 12 n=1 Tax=Diorhabda carinulata TaxID=1163345 RepID=UPI0025A1B791|nr:integrator complex subunit 12 [Diorhabda carinulata]